MAHDRSGVRCPLIPVALTCLALAVIVRELAGARDDRSDLVERPDYASIHRERDQAVARAITAEGVANRRLQVILETHRVVTLADDCGARWVRTTIPAILQHPDQEPALEMMSAVSSAKELTRKGAFTEGINHGRSA